MVYIIEFLKLVSELETSPNDTRIKFGKQDMTSMDLVKYMGNFCLPFHIIKLKRWDIT